MDIKDISVCLAVPENDRSVLEFAQALAAERQAHLTCAAFTLLPPIIYGFDGTGTDVYAAAIADTRVRMAAAWQAFEEKSRRLDQPLDFRQFEVFAGDSEFVSAINARHADLVVVGQPDPSGPHPHREILEGALLGGGRPVLVIPPGWATPRIGKRVVIGWDASREAARALHDGLLLAGPDARICLLTIDAKPSGSGYGGGPGWDIGAHLSRHGCEVNVRNEDGLSRAAADVILDVAADEEADLIILGGYRHPRFWQSVVPGVTRSVLKKTRRPVLLSH